jgi:transposase
VRDHPRIARRDVESSQRLSRHRFVAERSLAWLMGYRRLQVRYERPADVLVAFLCLGCALIYLKSQNQPKA